MKANMANRIKYIFFHIPVLNFLFLILSGEEILVLNITKTRAEDLEGRIVGGEPVPLESFPFQVQIFNYGSMCSGSIINSWTVLTAAHCFDINKNIEDMRVQAGSRYVYDFNARIYDVKTFVIHRNYNSTAQFVNDIALLFVNRPIQFGTKAKKAILVNNNAWMSPVERNFTVTGWGWTQYGGPISDLGLMMTHLRYVPSAECSRLHNLKISDDMFCLYGDGIRDTCKGDSGGGVLWNGQPYLYVFSNTFYTLKYYFHPVNRWVKVNVPRDLRPDDKHSWVDLRMIVGITSHGDGCAKLHKPSVYANVWHFRTWIQSNIYRFFNLICRQRRKKHLLG